MFSLRSRVGKVFDPTRFQGSLRKKHYFEGWYYKLVSADEKHALAFIPGIAIDKKGRQSQAFVQTIDGNTGKTDYFSYPLESFEAKRNRFEVRIGKNRFTAKNIELSLEGNGRQIAGELQFSELVPWRPSLLAPGIMGWYSYVPFMECYHGLVSLDHQIYGALEIDGQRCDLGGGRGYTEKDWGTSFPRGYLWVQSNHFETPGTSFMASIARIPWLNGAFTGFLAVLWHGGRLRVFSTYTKAKLTELNIDKTRFTAVIEDSRFRLTIDAEKSPVSKSFNENGERGVLKSPKKGLMNSRVVESLSSSVDLQLFEKKNPKGRERIIFAGKGQRAGLEIEATKAILAS